MVIRHAAMLNAIFTQARADVGLETGGPRWRLLSANVDHVISYALHFFLETATRVNKIT
jgi:hypothetical protein